MTARTGAVRLAEIAAVNAAEISRKHRSEIGVAQRPA